MGTTDSELLNYTVNGASVTAFFTELQGLLDSTVASVTALQDAFAAFDDTTSTATASATGLDDVITVLRDSFATLDETIAANTAALNDNTLATDDNAAATDAEAASVKKATVAHDASNKTLDVGKLKMVALAGTAVLLAGAFETVKMAGNFEQENTLLVTSAGELQKNIGMVSDGILKMSVSTATSTTSLEAAMFVIESSGAHGAAGLAELQAAAEGAKVENADLTGVVQALATTMHDWREPASQAIDVMNSFREAASIGNMRMDDFTGAMKNVGPVASLLKIPLSDIEAALSTMSLEGDKGAAAGTHLAQSLMTMIHPSAAAIKTLKEIGMTSQQVSDDLKKSLPDTLATITDALGKKFPVGSAAYNAALATMFGGTRGLKSILELTGQNLRDFQKDAQAIAPTMQANATAVDGWAMVQHNFNFQLGQAHEALNAVLIKVGRELLPMLEVFLSKVVMPAISNFQAWATSTTGLHDAFQTVVDVLGTVITTTETLVSWFGQAGPQGTILKDVLIGIGIAVATIKLAELAGNLENLATNIIPQALVKFGFLQATLDTTAASEVAVGVAADGASLGVAASFTAMLGPIGLVIAAALLASQVIASVPPIPTTKTITTNTGPNGSPVQTTVSNPDNIGAVKNQGIDTIMQTKTNAQRKQDIIDAANALAIAKEKALEQTLIDAYATYSATLQKNQQINDTIMREHHLKTQQDEYALNDQYYKLKLQQAGSNYIALEKLAEQNAYNLLTKTAYAWTGLYTVVQNGVNKDYQTITAGYQKSADEAASQMEKMKQVVAQKWQDINGIQATQAGRTQDIIRNGFQSAADIAAKQLEQVRQVVQDKWNQINNIMSHQIVLNVDTVFSSSGAKPVIPTTAHASGGFDLKGGFSSLNEFGTEGAYVPSGSNILPHNSFASIMDSIPQLQKAVSGLVNQQHRSGNTAQGGSGGITIHGDVHLHGVQNVAQLWQEMNEYGGLGFEYGGRGATAGH